MFVESKGRYRRLLELIRVPIVTLDLKSTIPFVNATRLCLSGYSQDKLNGKYVIKVKSLKVKKLSKFLKMLSLMIEGKLPSHLRSIITLTLGE